MYIQFRLYFLARIYLLGSFSNYVDKKTRYFGRCGTGNVNGMQIKESDPSQMSTGALR